MIISDVSGRGQGNSPMEPSKPRRNTLKCAQSDRHALPSSTRPIRNHPPMSAGEGGGGRGENSIKSSVVAFHQNCARELSISARELYQEAATGANS
jgi:hypothetical protein